MPVTAQDVIACYRYILGREPESEAVIEQALQVKNVDDLRLAFLRSDEFQKKYADCTGATVTIPVGLHLGVPECDVEVSARPDQLEKMLSRTAETWRELGQTEPHWSVLTSDRYKAASIDQTRDEFYRTGHDQVAFLEALFGRSGYAFPKDGVCLDFGCGVGRITLALAPHFAKVIGVDVSASHLKIAIERQQQQNISNVIFKSIGQLDDISQLDRFDMLVTFIVRQHNPPPIIAAILDRLLSHLNPGGFAVFQLPTFIANYRFSISDYLAAPRSPNMEMHPLPQRHVYKILERNSCRLIEVREDCCTGSTAMVSQTFFVRKAAD